VPPREALAEAEGALADAEALVAELGRRLTEAEAEHRRLERVQTRGGRRRLG
jgi:hypothetical protein